MAHLSIFVLCSLCCAEMNGQFAGVAVTRCFVDSQPSLSSSGRLSLIIITGCVVRACSPFAVAKSLCAIVSLSSSGASCTKCSTTTITAAEMRRACSQAAEMLMLCDALSPSHRGSERELLREVCALAAV